jgi:ferritin-like protein
MNTELLKGRIEDAVDAILEEAQRELRIPNHLFPAFSAYAERLVELGSKLGSVRLVEQLIDIEATSLPERRSTGLKMASTSIYTAAQEDAMQGEEYEKRLVAETDLQYNHLIS